MRPQSDYSRPRSAPASDGEFVAAQDSLMPVLKASFQPRRLPEEPLRRDFAGNPDVIYVVDEEDSSKVVTSVDIDRWQEEPDEITRIALNNLHDELWSFV